MKNRYLNYVKSILASQRKYIFFLVATILVSSIMAVLLPYIHQSIINQVFIDKNFDIFNFLILISLGLYILQSIFGLLKDYIQSKFNENICKNLKLELNREIAKKEYRHYLETGNEILIQRYTNDTKVIASHISSELFNLGEQVIGLAFASFMVFRISREVLLCSLILLSVFFFVSKKIGGILNKEIKKLYDDQEKSVGCFMENYSNNFLVKIYNLYSWIEERFQRVYSKEYKQSIKTAVIYSSSINITKLIINFILVFVWLLGGYRIKNGVGTIGEIVALIEYVGLLVTPFYYFGQFNNSFQEVNSSMERINKEFEIPKEDIENGVKLLDIEEIKIDNIKFGYEKNKFSLRISDFIVKKGEVIGVKGESGSGKSTFINLLIGLYHPIEGNLFINSMKSSTINLLNIREQIGYIAQDSLFFEDTIKENLFGNYNQEIIDRYAIKLDIYDAIIKTQDGYDTVLLKNASNLSGGQKKRLDIMRALLAEKDVLIFDETTSMLDQKRKDGFYHLIEEFRKDKIIIIITHNIEEWSFLDRIYEIEEGRMKYIGKV